MRRTFIRTIARAAAVAMTVATLAAITASRTEFSAAPAISSLAKTALYHCHDSPSKRLIDRPALKEYSTRNRIGA